MSKEVDERVVEMKFDNKDFEKNCRATIEALGNLKKKLEMSKAAKGLKSIGDTAKQISLDHLEASVDTISKRFTNLGIIGVTALQNITNSALNTGKRLVSAITIDPIRDGLAEYETQMNAVQTILANTQKEGTNVKIVNAALDDLNTYADKTIYNFTEMTRNIGTFTAAGVKLNDSVSAIKGIANLAAMSGSSSMQASTAMYQLSQALAAGKVQLMDWNSVVNAGMGGQVFQDALIRTSEHLKTGAQQAIKANGSFRESLTKTGWLTTEVLTQTLDQFATAADTEEEYNAAIKKFVSQGYSQEQAKQIADMARTAGDAATKVKTFTQLIDTLKEALGSGWTETWRTVIGDFEEAKKLWTNVSDVFNDFINKSSDARNTMLKEWADAGGRKKLIKSFANAFKGLISIVKPVKEAFRDIFPRTTSAQLLSLTDKLEKITSKFKIGDRTAKDLKNTFAGLFSVVRLIRDIFFALLKVLSPITSVIGALAEVALSITGAFGSWASTFDITVDSVEKQNTALQTFKDKLKGASEGVGELLRSLEPLNQILSLIGSGLKYIIETGLANLPMVVTALLTSSMGLSLVKLLQTITKKIDSVKTIGDKFASVMDSIKTTVESFKKSVSPASLISIAVGIGILAGALLMLSFIEKDKIVSSMGTITALMAEILVMMTAVNKISSIGKPAIANIGTIVSIAIAVGLFAASLKAVSSIDNAVGSMKILTVLMIELIGIAYTLTKIDGKIKRGVKLLKSFSVSILILASAVKLLGGLNADELTKGLGGITVLLAELLGFMTLAKYGGIKIKDATAILVISAAIVILSGAVSVLGRMPVENLIKGIGALAGVLAVIVILSSFSEMSPKLLIFAGAMLAISASVAILAGALVAVGSLSFESMTTGLVGLIGALATVVLVMNTLSGSIPGALALLVVSASLAVLGGVILMLGQLGWQDVVTGLLGIAGAFVIFAGLSAILSALSPAIVSFGGSLIVLGLGIAAVGGGMSAIAFALSMIMTAITSFIKSMGSLLQTIQELNLSDVAVKFTAFAAAIIALGVGSVAATPLLAALGAALAILGIGGIAAAAGITLLTGAMSLMNIGATASFVLIEKSIDKVIVKFSKMETSVVVLVYNYGHRKLNNL